MILIGVIKRAGRQRYGCIGSGDLKQGVLPFGCGSRRTLGKHKETGSRSSGHDARASSGDYCHGHLASVTGAPRSRTFTYRLPRSGLVYWRKIIAGRALIAARIYRGFWTNGNGFLRGIRIGLISGDACIFGLFRENWHGKIILETFANVFTPRQAGNVAAALRSLACRQAEKYAGNASLAQASCPGPVRGSRAGVRRLCKSLCRTSNRFGQKKKGGPRAALPVPDAGMVISDGFRLSHHVHTASSARLTR